MTREELDQVESSQRQHHEIMHHQEKMNIVAEKEAYNLFQILKPRLFIDGNMWCCLYGENIQDGVCGFGKSPYKAILDFNKSWDIPIKDTK